MTGSDLARVMSAGAAGGAMGTRFLTTHEATFSDAKRRAVQTARVTSSPEEVTIRSVAWDRLSGAKWPGLSQHSNLDIHDEEKHGRAADVFLSVC